jgi:DNA-binding CsgD family transcriptional regulator
VVDEYRELDRTRGPRVAKGLSEEVLPEAIAALAAWLRATTGGAADADIPICRLGGDGHGSGDGLCRWMQPPDKAMAASGSPCELCDLMQGSQPDWRRIVELFVQCRAWREFSGNAAQGAHTSHIAAIMLTAAGHVLDSDYRGESFLRSGNVLRLQGGQLACAETACQPLFNAALRETMATGRSSNLLVHAIDQPGKRYSLTLSRMQRRPPAEPRPAAVAELLCLVAPLDGRRIATARQLMDLFGLSAAEARLARALCHGDSVEEYARDQGLRQPTVRTQLSSIFAKTHTERQVELVRLIVGIPVVRDPA